MTGVSSNSITIKKVLRSVGRSRDYSRSPSRVSKSPARSHISPSKPTFTIFSDDLKENISPVRVSKKEKRSLTKPARRIPLASISITAVPGYITIDSESVQLLNEWVPSASRALSTKKSMTIYKDLPSYLTPPRRVFETSFKTGAETSQFKHFDIYEDQPELPESRSRIVFTLDDNKENIPPKLAA